MMHKVVLAVLFTLSVVGSNPAWAQEPEPIEHTNQGADILSAISILGAITVMTADIVYAVDDESWVPPAWAWTEVAVSAMNISSGIWQLSASDGRTGMGITNLVFGIPELGHAIASLLLYDPPPQAAPSPTENPVAFTIRPHVATIRDGSVAGIVGTF